MIKSMIGAHPIPETNLWEFRIWAPLTQQIELHIPDVNQSPFSLQRENYGYWSIRLEGAEEGMLYQYKLNDQLLADPASLSQPEGVHGPSALVDVSSYSWTDATWSGIPLKDLIVYELHTGTFTAKGTFADIQGKLDYLLELGINTIELMPVGQFPGTRNWGYDGVFPFAVQDSYGGPQGLMSLINACHRKGMAVILDVVINHLGPEGNYLSHFGPYFTENYKTPWGKSINYDDAYSDGVRNYFLQLCLSWIRDFHFDGLRLDAIHAIKDFSPTHILADISEEVSKLKYSQDREIHLIGESDLNDPKYITPINQGGYGLDAQWCDEFHHAVHAYVTGERNAYYEDFGDLWHITKTLRDAYVYDGVYSSYRKKTFGKSTEGIPGEKFLVCLQNHDQIGNRMLGERMGQLISFEMLKVAAGLTFISPFTPLMFMGEEYGEKSPFLYFIDHQDPALVEAVREGRKSEFAAFHNKGEAPDPKSETTFQTSTLPWSRLREEHSQALLSYYRKWIFLRKTNSVLRHGIRENMIVEKLDDDHGLIINRWHESFQLLVICNLSPNSLNLILPPIIDNSEKAWSKILDSTAKEWEGSGESSPDKWDGRSEIIVNQESLVLYMR